MCIFHNGLKIVNKYIFITVPGYPQNVPCFINYLAKRADGIPFLLNLLVYSELIIH